MAKIKGELVKAKDETTKQKNLVQAKSNASKEDEKAKARSASKIASLEKDNERLDNENTNKARDLKRQQDRSEQLERDIKDHKLQIEKLERDKTRSLVKQPTSRKFRDWDDNDDEEESGANEYVTAQRKKSRLSIQPSIQPSTQDIIQQQVAEALSRLLPPALTSQPLGHRGAEVHPPPPPVHQMSAHQYESGYGQYHSRDLSHGTDHRYQVATTTPSMRFAHHTAPVQAEPKTPASSASSKSYWPSHGFDISTDTPLGAALNALPPPIVPASQSVLRPVSSPAEEAGNSEPELFKQFQEFMSMKKKQ